jgi:hypothetical protein
MLVATAGKQTRVARDPGEPSRLELLVDRRHLNARRFPESA